MSDLGCPIVEKHGGIYVVRDDLVEGGTKRRGVGGLIKDGEEFVYASPAYGYAQLAISHACRDANKQAVLFTAKRKELHPLTKRAEELGAEVIQVEHGYLTVTQARARAYCGEGLFREDGRVLLPFGLDCLEMVEGISADANLLDVSPREVWCAMSSGTLSRSLQKVWPNAKHFGVRTGAEPENSGRAEIVNAPEKYNRPAKQPPPFPSCPNYDAKVWKFVKDRPGALYWNM